MGILLKTLGSWLANLALAIYDRWQVRQDIRALERARQAVAAAEAARRAEIVRAQTNGATAVRDELATRVQRPDYWD